MAEYSVSLGLQVQQALRGLKQLTSDFLKLDKEVDEVTASLNKFEQELKDEAKTIANTTNAQNKYIQKLQAQANALDRNSAKYKIINRQIALFAKQNRSAASAAQQLAGAVAGIGVGVGFSRLIGELKQTGIQFGDASGAVKTLAKDDFPAIQAAIKSVVDEQKGLTNEIDANTAAYQLLSAGVSDAAGVQKTLTASVKLAKAGFTDTATAVDGLTTVINAYGLSTAQAAKVADQFAQTQNDGKITIGQYAANIGKVAPIAAALGISLEEVNAALARSTALGSQADVAVTGLRSAFTKLSAPGDAQTKLLDKYSLVINAATIEADGLIGTLKKLQKVTSKEDLLKITGTEAGTTIQQLLSDLPRLDAAIPKSSRGIRHAGSGY